MEVIRDSITDFMKQNESVEGLLVRFCAYLSPIAVTMLESRFTPVSLCPKKCENGRAPGKGCAFCGCNTVAIASSGTESEPGFTTLARLGSIAPAGSFESNWQPPLGVQPPIGVGANRVRSVHGWLRLVAGRV